MTTLLKLKGSRIESARPTGVATDFDSAGDVSEQKIESSDVYAEIYEQKASFAPSPPPPPPPPPPSCPPPRPQSFPIPNNANQQPHNLQYRHSLFDEIKQMEHITDGVKNLNTCEEEVYYYDDDSDDSFDE